MRVRITPEYPELVVSDDGRIQGPSGKWLSCPVGSGGYRQVSRGTRTTMHVERVHVIVCTAFHGPRPKGREVLHTDGDRLNNRADNLRWGTRSENVADARSHGTLIQGSASPLTHLTDADVGVIRDSPLSGKELAVCYGVSPMTISRIRNRKTWKYLP